MTTPRKPFAERLRAGLSEALAHAQGELTLKTIEHPDDPPEIPPESLVALRHELAMSQAVLAKILSTSVKTIQSWEQGKREPSMAARRLIQVLVVEPEAVSRTVGVQFAKIQGLEIKKLTNGRSQIVMKKPPTRKKAQGANKPAARSGSATQEVVIHE